ncbi:MAG: elongation factor G [Proteobacteria bacterium]|nr:elongation factor G [Pseudomonadota bacterium]
MCADRATCFALIGHGGDGKTTLADSLLVAAGVTGRQGSVEDGTSFMNYQPEEKARRVTISASICSFEREDGSYTLIDTPGDSNFAGEMQAALNAVDSAVLVLSARDGVRVGTEKAFRQARERGVALVAVANKMDLDRADFGVCARQAEELFGVRVVPLHYPVGSGEEFEGFVDLLSGRMRRCADGGVETVDPPAELADEIEAAHLEMVEAVAEGDDAILEKYLESGEISEEEVLDTLRKGVREGSLLPLMCAAAARGVGGTGLIWAAERILPDASEMEPRSAVQGEEEVSLGAADDAPSALVFKSIADRYAGTLSIFRVVSGQISLDSTLANARTRTKERITKILRLQADSTREVQTVRAGEIAAIPKLKDTRTGDTLCAEKSSLSFPTPEAPRGVISFSVEAEEKGDEDKVFESLNRLADEDPSLSLGRDERTGEFLLNGLGQLHIEVTLEKLRRLFGVNVKLNPPKVPYLETIRTRVDHVEGKHKKQSGGRGQFGVCFLTVEPGERGSGVQFVDEIHGGSIPRQYIPAVEKGVREACERGMYAGYPMTDLVIRCIDGKYHSVDSSEMAFKTAGSKGIKAAVSSARPTLLEPVMDMEIAVPGDFVGDIMGDLNGRRGKVAGVDSRGATDVVKAQVPMSEVLSYASDLTSLTGGQGSFSMEFSHYEETPASIQQKLAAEAELEDEE